MKVRNNEVEFILFDCDWDGEKVVFCRKKPKNKFIGFFTPWKQAKIAYNHLSGYTTSFDPEEFAALRERVKTWDDFKEWCAEQKEKSKRNSNAIKESWDSLIK